MTTPGLKLITVFPEYPASLHQPEERAGYRRKILHAHLEAASLIPVLNSPSPLLRTVDGHHVNKAFIVAVRDYADPARRKSPQADYERRTQVQAYVAFDLATLEEVSAVVSVRKICDDLEVCLERALIGEGPYEFIGARTDFATTGRLDALLDPSVMKVFESVNLSQSYLAINKHFIKNFTLIRPLASGEAIEGITEPPLFPG